MFKHLFDNINFKQIELGISPTVNSPRWRVQVINARISIPDAFYDSFETDTFILDIQLIEI